MFVVYTETYCCIATGTWNCELSQHTLHLAETPERLNIYNFSYPKHLESLLYSLLLIITVNISIGATLIYFTNNTTNTIFIVLCPLIQ